MAHRRSALGRTTTSGVKRAAAGVVLLAFGLMAGGASATTTGSRGQGALPPDYVCTYALRSEADVAVQIVGVPMGKGIEVARSLCTQYSDASVVRINAAEVPAKRASCSWVFKVKTTYLFLSVFSRRGAFSPLVRATVCNSTDRGLMGSRSGPYWTRIK